MNDNQDRPTPGRRPTVGLVPPPGPGLAPPPPVSASLGEAPGGGRMVLLHGAADLPPVALLPELVPDAMRWLIACIEDLDGALARQAAQGVPWLPLGRDKRLGLVLLAYSRPVDGALRVVLAETRGQGRVAVPAAQAVAICRAVLTAQCELMRLGILGMDGELPEVPLPPPGDEVDDDDAAELVAQELMRRARLN